MKNKFILILFWVFLITPSIQKILAKRFKKMTPKARRLSGEEEALNEAEPIEEQTEKKDDKDDAPDIIKSLEHRAYSINDKIDHLLFHHNHDLTGKQAQFTPYGVHFLPKYKGNDSIDQKLKMVDYMHTMGGYAPGAGFMTPYLFSHSPNANTNNSPVPTD